MKKNYQAPKMFVEMFTPNQAISLCTVTSTTTWTFDCMAGDTVDTGTGIVNSALSATCDNQIGYKSGCTTARDYGGFGSNTNYNPTIAKWSNDSGTTTGATSSESGDYLQVTYTGAQGLLYTDNNRNTSAWDYDSTNNVVFHKKSGGGWHHNVAPVMNESSVSPSW